jgi:hypothetical protein
MDVLHDRYQGFWETDGVIPVLQRAEIQEKRSFKESCNISSLFTYISTAKPLYNTGNTTRGEE